MNMANDFKYLNKNTLEILSNEKLEHRSVLCNEREKDCLDTLPIVCALYDARSQ